MAISLWTKKVCSFDSRPLLDSRNHPFHDEINEAGRQLQTSVRGTEGAQGTEHSKPVRPGHRADSDHKLTAMVRILNEAQTVNCISATIWDDIHFNTGPL